MIQKIDETRESKPMVFFSGFHFRVCVIRPLGLVAVAENRLSQSHTARPDPHLEHNIVENPGSAVFVHENFPCSRRFFLRTKIYTHLYCYTLLHICVSPRTFSISISSSSVSSMNDTSILLLLFSHFFLPLGQTLSIFGVSAP